MANPFGGFGSGDSDSSFEQGNPVQQGVKKAAQAVGGQVAKQAQQATQDIVSQLFGADFSKSPDNGGDKTFQTQKQGSQQANPSSAAAQLAQMQNQQQKSEFPGIQTPEDQEKYSQLTQQLGEEKRKEQGNGMEEKRAHMRDYFDPYIGTLETQLKKLKQQADQKKQQDAQQEEKKKEQDEIQLEEKKKQNIAMQRAQRSTEVKQGGGG